MLLTFNNKKLNIFYNGGMKMNATRKRGVIVGMAIISVIIMAVSLTLVSISYGREALAAQNAAVVNEIGNAPSRNEEDVVSFDFGKTGLLRGTNNYIGDCIIDNTQFYIRIIVENKLWPYRDNFEIQIWNEGNVPYNVKIDKAGFYWKSGTFQSCVTTGWVLKNGKCWYGPYYSDGTKEQKWAADYVEIKMQVLKGIKYGDINARFYVGRTEVEHLG